MCKIAGKSRDLGQIVTTSFPLRGSQRALILDELVE